MLFVHLRLWFETSDLIICHIYIYVFPIKANILIDLIHSQRINAESVVSYAGEARQCD